MHPKNALSDPQSLQALREPLATALLAWFDRAQRDMPWRKTRDPYAIWLSETMLQQTQVETVKPYYHKFLARFPTVQDLAAAPLSDVLGLWAGLGYYRRAKHLHAAAQAIVAEHAGTLPGTAAQLQLLPGVGRYTAGAVASIAYGESVPVVDGNVMRVLTRVLDLHADIALPQTQKRLWVMAEQLVPPASPAGRPGDFNQALMELGATVCTPRKPACLLCPLRSLCQGFARGTAESLPVKGRKKPTPVVQAWAVVLWRPAEGHANGSAVELLVMQRAPGGLWEHLWESPVLAWPATEADGKSALTVARSQALAAAIQRQLGVQVAHVQSAGEVVHQLTHRRMEYTVHVAQVTGGQVALPAPAGKSPALGAYDAWRWVVAEELLRGSAVPLAKAARRVLETGLEKIITQGGSKT